MIWSIFHFMLNSKQHLYEVTRLVTGEKHLLTKLPATADGQTSGMHEVTYTDQILAKFLQWASNVKKE